MAVIVQDGIRRMYEEREDIFYYLTVYNENYADAGRCRRASRKASCKGIYQLPGRAPGGAAARRSSSAAAPILREALRAQALLAERFGVAADVWSVTSYKELRRDALAVRALEPPAPGRAAAPALRRPSARRRRRGRSSPPPTT